MAWLSALLVPLLSGPLSRPVLATTAEMLCPGGTGPCIVRDNVSVEPGSDIDVGDRHLVIASGGTLNVGSGDMTITAGRLTVEQGGALRAPGSASTEGGFITASAGVISIAGRIDAAGAPGGSVTLTSDAELIIAGSVDATSRNREEDGGSVTLQGATVEIGAPVSVTGGREGFGGEIDVRATGDLTVSRTLEANGGEGGSITLEAGAGGQGNLTITPSGRIQGDAVGDGGFGDIVDLSASGNGIITGLVIMDGLVSSSGTSGGSGGTIFIVADGTITATDRSARLEASGGRPLGDGGEIELSTFDGGLTSTATVDVRGGPEGRGGDVSLTIAGAIRLGGSVEASAGAVGGRVEIRSDADAVLEGTIRTDSADQAGGRIRVEACMITVDARATLSNLGSSGNNHFVGRDQTVVRGTIRASDDTGLNEIVYSSEQRRPIVFASARIEPPAAETLDATLVPCIPVNTPLPTSTRTRTPTPTSTRTSTTVPTRTPRRCVGDCNGRAGVTINELVIGVNIVLQVAPVTACPSFDQNRSGAVEINELVIAVNNVLEGCPSS